MHSFIRKTIGPLSRVIHATWEELPKVAEIPFDPEKRLFLEFSGPIPETTTDKFSQALRSRGYNEQAKQYALFPKSAHVSALLLPYLKLIYLPVPTALKEWDYIQTVDAEALAHIVAEPATRRVDPTPLYQEIQDK